MLAMTTTIEIDGEDTIKVVCSRCVVVQRMAKQNEDMWRDISRQRQEQVRKLEIEVQRLNKSLALALGEK